MPGFKRVFPQFPGFNTLGNIESVNTIDITPPQNPLGAGTGITCVVGEFERGPFNAPIQVFGGSEQETTFGGFGYTYDGEPYVYPVASRSAGSNDANTWNGNGWIATRNKRFAGIILCRVDNSAGEVEFSRLACVTGGQAPFDLVPNDTLAVSLDGAAAGVVTFLATQGSITGVGGTYPTAFVGGETLEVSIDDLPTQVVVFEAADQTLNQVIDRINGATASSIASDSGGELQLDSRIFGYSASIEVIGGTALAILGLPGPAVEQVTQVTIANNSAGLYTIRTEVVVAGVLTAFDASYTAAALDTTTVIRDALLNAAIGLGVPGITYTVGPGDSYFAAGDLNVDFAVTIFAEPAALDVNLLTTPGTFTKALGTGNVANIDLVTSGEVISLAETIPGVMGDLDPNQNLRLCNSATPGTGSILIEAISTAAAALGLPVGQTVFANQGPETVIPAGTRVRDSVTQAVYVVIQDVEVPENEAGPYTAKVRPGVDNDTTPTALAGDLTELVDILPAAYAVTNSADVQRLDANQMDVRYLDAINSTVDVSGVPFEINIIYSARTSVRINEGLRANAIDTTATGHRARKAVVSPPLATSVSDASGEVGVGVGNVGRDQRVFYVFPGLAGFIPEIAQKGVAGGTGFTADGVINVQGAGYYASVGSILPPEENRGQQLSTSNYGPLRAVALEDAYNKEVGGQGLTIENYIAFKADGIIAPRNERAAGIAFQSDITSVNPAVQPGEVDAKRRFMGDFIIDTLSDIGGEYVKKLNTPARRRALFSSINGFLELLLSPNSPDTSRIEDFATFDETTDEQRALGFQIINVAVRIFPSIDFIVYRTTVGTTVDVEEIVAG